MLASLKFVERFISLPQQTETVSVNGLAFQRNTYDLSIIAPLLTRQGFEVEAVKHVGEGFDSVIVGKIESCERHPNAEKLSVCQVNDGSGKVRQIVCGAKNARAGLFVAVALPGCVLPGDKKIGAAAIRNVESFGMLCAREELALPSKTEVDGEGIWELDVDAQGGKPRDVLEKNLGKPVFDVLEIRDTLLELNVTPNRPDMLCHAGVARELKAGFDFAKINYETRVHSWQEHCGWQTSELIEKVTSTSQVSVANTVVSCENQLGAPTYFVVVDEVKVKSTPGWMRIQLENLGQNSVNSVVDASNYILLAFGQPSHAFDLAKLATTNGQTKLSLRFATDKEKFLGLDGKERELAAVDGVVADVKEPQALLGVLGGDKSKVETSTKTIVIEIANPSPVAVRRTSRRIGRITDASFMFEKGVDVSARWDAATELIGLISSLSQEKPKIVGAFHSKVTKRSSLAESFIEGIELKQAMGPLSESGACVDMSVAVDRPTLKAFADARWKDYAQKLQQRYTISYNKAHLPKVVGAEILDFKSQVKILKSLGFAVSERADAVEAVVPHWRRYDIAGYADLVEEVVRVVGIDAIPLAPLTSSGELVKDDMHLQLIEQLSNRAVALGYTEIIGLHFMREDDLPRLGMKTQNALGAPLRILNPIIQDEPLAHTTLIPDLLRKVAYNLNYGTKSGLIFHLTRTFANADTSGKTLFGSDNSVTPSALFDYAPASSYAYSREKDQAKRPVETPRLAGVAFGNKEDKTWQNSQPVRFDLHTVISHVLEIGRAIGAGLEVVVLPADHPMAPALHPGRRAGLAAKVGQTTQIVGWVGEFHPAALRAFEIETNCLGFELNVASLMQSISGGFERRVRPPRRFPVVSRDFAFLVESSLQAGTILKTVSTALQTILPTQVPASLLGVNIFDVYTGTGVPEGKKSVAFNITIEPSERTLTDADIQRVMTATINAVVQECKGELRG